MGAGSLCSSESRPSRDSNSSSSRPLSEKCSEFNITAMGASSLCSSESRPSRAAKDLAVLSARRYAIFGALSSGVVGVWGGGTTKVKFCSRRARSAMGSWCIDAAAPVSFGSIVKNSESFRNLSSPMPVENCHKKPLVDRFAVTDAATFLFCWTFLRLHFLSRCCEWQGRETGHSASSTREAWLWIASLSRS